ncbi:helix-turn-helix domain-containing protein [Endothiovibrio diazotrophicus]
MSDYGARINRALNYARERLPALVELDEVARIAAFSPYHFHRVFLLVVGETFAGFMRKRRLEWAAMELLNSRRRILDISLDAGYETQESFARAFKAQFDITPGRFRSRVRSPQEAFRGVQSAFEIQLGDLMKPAIVEWDHFVAVGLQKDYDHPDFSGALAQWEAFRIRSAEIDAVDRNCCYGVSVVSASTRRRNRCAGVFRYLAACEAADRVAPPEGMTRLLIPPQKYARYTFTGPVSGFQAFIMNVWTRYLPESGLEPIESPEIEVYDERFDLASHDSQMDYLIPIR